MCIRDRAIDQPWRGRLHGLCHPRPEIRIDVKRTSNCHRTDSMPFGRGEPRDGAQRGRDLIGGQPAQHLGSDLDESLTDNIEQDDIHRRLLYRCRLRRAHLPSVRARWARLDGFRQTPDLPSAP